MISISAVIPVYNEADSLEELHRQLDEVARANDYQLEFIFVDDGSSDASWSVIAQLAQRDPRVRGIRFRRNFGKAAGLSAGFAAAEGDFVVTLDADLQDDPEEIPRLLAELDRGGYDMVTGYKQVRHDPWHKVYPSRVFNWMVSTLTGVKLHDHNCGLKCYRREVVKEVRLYGEMHRFVPVLADAKGFTVGELIVQHRARQFGSSKYGLERFIKGFLDLLTVKFLTGYGHRPQHFLGTVGIILLLFGFGGLGLIAALWVGSRITYGWFGLGDFFHISQHLASTLASLVSLFFGGQLLSIGFLGELITSQGSQDREPFVVSQRVGEASDEGRESSTESRKTHQVDSSPQTPSSKMP